MKTMIQIPKFLHELFGTQQNRSELILIILFTITSTLLVAWFTSPYWQTLTWVQSLVLWLLFLDISGGVVANLSEGTNNYYNDRLKSRLDLHCHTHPTSYISDRFGKSDIHSLDGLVVYIAMRFSD
jgi:hypothetical protein